MTWAAVIQLLRFSESAEEINSKRNEIAKWIPKVEIMFDYDQNNYYHQYDLWMHCVHTVLGLNREIDDDMLLLAALLHDIGKPSCKCRSKRPDDIYAHYYGHPDKSEQIVREEIIPELKARGVEFDREDANRLLYYVKYHDDYVSLKEEYLESHLKMVNVEVFKNLMELQVADAKAHALYPIIQQRIDICSEWKNGRADKINVSLE